MTCLLGPLSVSVAAVHTKAGNVHFPLSRAGPGALPEQPGTKGSPDLYSKLSYLFPTPLDKERFLCILRLCTIITSKDFFQGLLTKTC